MSLLEQIFSLSGNVVNQLGTEVLKPLVNDLFTLIAKAETEKGKGEHNKIRTKEVFLQKVSNSGDKETLTITIPQTQVSAPDEIEIGNITLLAEVVGVTINHQKEFTSQQKEIIIPPKSEGDIIAEYDQICWDGYIRSEIKGGLFGAIDKTGLKFWLSLQPVRVRFKKL